MIKTFGEDNYNKELFVPKPTFILESGFNAYILYTILLDVNYVFEDVEEFKKNEDG
jgi:inositol 1,4,5-triphosphate receptor type 3